MADSLYSMAERRRVLERWRRSGLSAAGFSGRAGVNAWTLYAWRRALARSAGAAEPARGGPPALAAAAAAFVELVAAPPARGGRTEAVVPACDTPAPSHTHAGIEILVRDPHAPGEPLAVRLHAGFDPATLRRVLDALHAPAVPHVADHASPARGRS